SLSGAKIEGAKVMSFEEAFGKYCEREEEFNPKEVLRNLSSGEKIGRRRLRRMSEDFKKRIESLKKMEKRSREGLNLAKELILILEKKDVERREQNLQSLDL
ncbi:MAG: hypothetical protein COS84_04390, partial [Armatimonadetes bacterium CG07_land_8_20_14_0_80_40_9]